MFVDAGHGCCCDGLWCISHTKFPLPIRAAKKRPSYWPGSVVQRHGRIPCQPIHRQRVDGSRLDNHLPLLHGIHRGCKPYIVDTMVGKSTRSTHLELQPTLVISVCFIIMLVKHPHPCFPAKCGRVCL